MKHKRTLLSLLLSTSTLGIASCGGFEASSPSSLIPAITLDKTAHSEQTTLKLCDEPDNQSLVDTFIDSIISQNGELIKGGIGAYGKCVVLNLLKECGIDLRDATTKTLEQIQKQLDKIEQKIDAIAYREEQIHAEDVLNNLLNEFHAANINYIPFAVKSLGDIATAENDPEVSEEEAEQRRLAFYNNTARKLTIDGRPLASYVTTLASYLIQPNPADRSKDVFFYYEKTIGTTDVWSIQRYKNTRNFMAYLDSTLINCANLAKFQMYYLSQGKDSATLAAYVEMMNNMADAVNAANEYFYKVNESLKPIAENASKMINTYLPAGEQYSTRMATLTYNRNDVEGDDSRQALLMSYVNDSGRYGNHQAAYSYKPGLIVNAVMNDFNPCSGAYCSSTYTIQDYLSYAGFFAKNDDLFQNAAGIFNGQFSTYRYGWLHDDKDYSITYYNQTGSFVRKNIYQLASYHSWTGRVNRTELRYLDDQYYLCFARGNEEGQKLDGGYEEVYMWDELFTVMNSCFFAPHYMEFVGEQTWPLHEN